MSASSATSGRATASERAARSRRRCAPSWSTGSPPRGLPCIEAVSFVSPTRVPQMAGAEEVVAASSARGVVYAGLVLNERGYDRLAADAGSTRCISRSRPPRRFNQRNSDAAPVAESVAAAARILERAHATGSGRPSRSAPRSVARSRERSSRPRCSQLAAAARRPEPDAIVLADTIGVGTPGQVRTLVRGRAIGLPVGVHLHNTRNTGTRTPTRRWRPAPSLDASVGGIGGCPFAPRATGNIATEDLVYMLHGEGIETGIDLEALIGVASWLEGVLGRQLDGQVYRAGTFAPVAG